MEKISKKKITKVEAQELGICKDCTSGKTGQCKFESSLKKAKRVKCRWSLSQIRSGRWLVVMEQNTKEWEEERANRKIWISQLEKWNRENLSTFNSWKREM